MVTLNSAQKHISIRDQSFISRLRVTLGLDASVNEAAVLSKVSKLIT